MDGDPDILAALRAIQTAVERLPGGVSGPRVDPTKVLSDPGKAVVSPAVRQLEQAIKNNATLRAGVNSGEEARARLRLMAEQREAARLEREAARMTAAAAWEEKGRGGRNFARLGAVGGAAAAGGGAILGAMGRAFSAVLPPLNLLANTLGSANSGLSLVSKTLGIMGAVLAPIILPFLFLFAAAVLYAAVAIQKHLWPALEKIWKELSPLLGDAFRKLADVIGFVIRGFENFLRAIGVVKDTPMARGQERLNARNAAKVDADLKANRAYPVRPPGEEAPEDTLRRLHEAQAELAELNKRNMFLPGQNTPDLSHPHEAYKQALREQIERLHKSVADGDRHQSEIKAENDRERELSRKGIGPDGAPVRRGPGGKPGSDEDIDRIRRAMGLTIPEEIAGHVGDGIAGAIPKAAPDAGKAGTGKPGPANKPPAAAGDLAGMTGIFDALLKSFELSLGPRAEIGGIGADVLQAAMMAALNQDPLEQIQMQFYRETLPMLRSIVAGIQGDKGTFKKD